jgi:hypothetical protein
LHYVHIVNLHAPACVCACSRVDPSQQFPSDLSFLIGLLQARSGGRLFFLLRPLSDTSDPTSFSLSLADDGAHWPHQQHPQHCALTDVFQFFAQRHMGSRGVSGVRRPRRPLLHHKASGNHLDRVEKCSCKRSFWENREDDGSSHINVVNSSLN